MSDKTELLPLPEPAFRLKWRDGAYYVSEPNIGNTDCYIAEQVRACVSSATEALRAEVALLRVGAENERLHASTLLRQERERAEQLAEALRLALKWAEVLPTGEPLRAESVRDLDTARAALEQEAGRE